MFSKINSLILVVAVMLAFAPKPASAQPVTFTSNTTIGCSDLTYEGYDVTVSACTLSVDCSHSFHSLTLINHAVVTHSPGQTNGMQLTISQNVSVDLTSLIDVSGKGYPQGTGTGAGGSASDAAGGGYGGTGGSIYNANGGASYGSATAPTDLGSGGGQGVNLGGGAGGGYVRLVIAGSLQLDGQLLANGANGFAPNWTGGGGSGGTIRINTATLSGSGSILSRGGNGGSWSSGGSGGGGGGRIALYYSSSSFSGIIAACGANGWDGTTSTRGGAGTIFIKSASQSNGNLFVDNCHLEGPMGTTASLTILDTLRVKSGGKLFIPNLNTLGSMFVDSGEVRLNTALTAAQVHVGSAGVLDPNSAQTLQVTVSGDFLIDSGGTVSATGRGFTQGNGPGAGATGSDGGGAGYGGNGGATTGISGGTAYGSITAPTDFGSGGGQGLNNGGGTGGGAIRLSIAGTLSVNGALAADGNPGIVPNWSGGGGSGGSIYVTSNNLMGNGSISVNGGAGGNWNSGGSGGGAGGRIALYATVYSFSGSLTACAGNGWNGTPTARGGAGTIYSKLASDPVGSLTISNCSSAGQPTPVINLATAKDIVVTGATLINWTGATTCSTLTVSQNSNFACATLQPLSFTVSHDVNIGFGCSINADGKGYGPGQGPGAGQSLNDGGGGGYGGVGGNAVGGELGGVTYGSESLPTDFGSGGGQGRNNGGGTGGGAIYLSVGRHIILDGTISANGTNGFAPSWSGGGGSGGSIYLTAAAYGGSGSVTANGGNGGSWITGGSGGGGGGRIALTSCVDTLSFSNVHADGGLGWNTASNGHPGTIFHISSGTDCNNNGIPDACEIALDPSLDCNNNGILDECEAFSAPQVTVIYYGSHMLLHWICVPHATGYQIYRATVPSVAITPANYITSTTNTSYDDTPAFNGSDKYFYAVIAVE